MRVYILWEKLGDKHIPIGITTDYDILYFRARMEYRVPLITEEDIACPEFEFEVE